MVDIVAKLDYNSIKWDTLLYYDETSPSCLRWKVNNGGIGALKRLAGDVAGCAYGGYFRIGIRGKKYAVHRIVWILNKGYLPPTIIINHKDCVGTNNNISNLELRPIEENRTLNNVAVHNVLRRNATNLEPFLSEQYSTVNGVKYWNVRVQYRDENNIKKTKAYSYLKYGKEEAWRLARNFLNSVVKYVNTIDNVKDEYKMKVKIVKCSDSRFWYNSKIGEIYYVRRIDNDCVWVRPEDHPYSGWNFIKKEDYVVHNDADLNKI